MNDVYAFNENLLTAIYLRNPEALSKSMRRFDLNNKINQCKGFGLNGKINQCEEKQ